ncbi:MAG: PAS domain S-box protein [Chloroflexaceae bacterium]|nr:PAS domain S-box protein [Chloroflexaceae bacterium]
MLGLAYIYSDQTFDPVEIDLLSRFANLASLVLENARLMAAERRRADELDVLRETMTDISTELDQARLLKVVVERAVTLLGAAGGRLAIYDEIQGDLEVVVSHHLEEHSIGQRIALGEGVLGQVAQMQLPLTISDDQWQSDRFVDTDNETLRSGLAAPLLVGSQLVGAICVMNRQAARHPNLNDLRLLNMFASQAAIALENARLYTKSQQRRQYFRDLVLINPVAIAITDLEHQVTTCNPSFEALFGYTRDEVIGHNLQSLIATESMVAEAMSTLPLPLDRPVRMISQRRRKDGSIIDVEVYTIAQIVDGEQSSILTLYHDITELARARREAEQASRAKSQFLANMSHELRTPLNAIIGYAEILLESVDDMTTEELASDLGKIQAAGRHLHNLIRDVLDLSKIEAGKMDLAYEAFDLISVAFDVISTIQPLVDQNHNQLEARFAQDEIPMVSDETKVRQVLFNLLSNACKFTDHGTITLDVLEKTTQEQELVIIRVCDTGVGMTAEQVGRIFQSLPRPMPQQRVSTEERAWAWSSRASSVR